MKVDQRTERAQAAYRAFAARQLEAGYDEDPPDWWQLPAATQARWLAEVGRVGVAVTCAVCGRTKKPAGRSLAPTMAGSYCDGWECDGYWQDPKPGNLWPGETQEEYGY